LKSTTSNQPIGELILGDSDVVRDMAFSPDGKLLAVSSAGNNSESTVTLFDVQRRDRLGQPLRVQDGRIFALSFSPDGKTLITATEERGLLSWDVDPESWRLRACAIANRNLTYDEWTQFLGEQPYRATCPMLPIDPNMLEEGRRRARSGDVEGAITIFERYRDLTSQLPFDPRKEALKFSVEELVANGRYLAESGDVDRGTVRLADAKRLDPSLPFDPGTEARRLAAPGLMASGEQLAQKGKIVEALQAFGRAQEYDPSLQGSAAAWDTLCWNGALRGHAAQVLAACERAVAAAPENGRIRTSRGLAKAIVAKVDEATADFEAFLAWEEKEQSHRMGLGRRKWLQEQRARHQQWIAELRSGQNPFTPAELQRLLAEESPD
jgi:tetratricopeptide (TPR) repeat protein